jgi:hypothetical protein
MELDIEIWQLNFIFFSKYGELGSFLSQFSKKVLCMWHNCIFKVGKKANKTPPRPPPQQQWGSGKHIFQVEIWRKFGSKKDNKFGS